MAIRELFGKQDVVGIFRGFREARVPHVVGAREARDPA